MKIEGKSINMCNAHEKAYDVFASKQKYGFVSTNTKSKFRVALYEFVDDAYALSYLNFTSSAIILKAISIYITDGKPMHNTLALFDEFKSIVEKKVNDISSLLDTNKSAMKGTDTSVGYTFINNVYSDGNNDMYPKILRSEERLQDAIEDTTSTDNQSSHKELLSRIKDGRFVVYRLTPVKIKSEIKVVIKIDE